jgi:hypothetical protein
VRRASSAEEHSTVPGGGRACSIQTSSRGGRPEDRASSAPAAKGGYTLWLWVAAGFLFMGLLWTGMVIATRHADTRTVPLAGKEARP